MSQQSTKTKTADQLTAGDHIRDGDGVHEVVHVLPYRDGDGRQHVASTLRPLGRGVPFIKKHFANMQVELATDADVSEWQAEGVRRSLADALHQLADDIIDHQLPAPAYRLNIHGCVDTRTELERWAKHLAADIRMGGSEKNIPVATGSLPVADGLVLEVHFQSDPEPTEPQPAAADAQAGA